MRIERRGKRGESERVTGGVWCWGREKKKKNNEKEEDKKKKKKKKERKSGYGIDEGGMEGRWKREEREKKENI